MNKGNVKKCECGEEGKADRVYSLGARNISLDYQATDWVQTKAALFSPRSGELCCQSHWQNCGLT